MTVYPAIDILGGKAVRLTGGDYDKVTVYGDPIDFAKRFIDEGAEYIHAVDLDAARSSGNNFKILEKIAALNVKLQTGGGVRTYADARNRINCGVDTFVLGTVCCKNPDLAAKIISDFTVAAVIGADCVDGFIAVNGWREVTSERLEEFIKKYIKHGAKRAVVTDVSRDGKLSGVNTELCAVATRAGAEVIASGGASSPDDVKRVKQAGVYGLILGKAIYENKLTAAQAIALSR